jgi:phasin family protein
VPFFVATPKRHLPEVPRPVGVEQTMFQNFDEMQKLTKENTDIAMKNFNTVSKGVQAIAVEVADYSKKSFEEGTAALEKLFGAKTLDKAIEVQSDYFKTAYEGFVAEATKIGELYADLAKEAYKPIETAMAKAK